MAKETLCFSIFVAKETLKKPLYLQRNPLRLNVMAKGPEKDGKNKALHTKLLNRKKAKVQEEKKERALRLKEIITKMNQQKTDNESEN